MRILVVEDDPVLSRQLVETLTRAGEQPHAQGIDGDHDGASSR